MMSREIKNNKVKHIMHKNRNKGTKQKGKYINIIIFVKAQGLLTLLIRRIKKESQASSL